MHFTEDDWKNLCTLLGVLAALAKSFHAGVTAKKANKTAGAAQDRAEELVTLCSYPTCGHVCPAAPQAPTPPANKPPRALEPQRAL